MQKSLITCIIFFLVIVAAHAINDAPPKLSKSAANLFCPVFSEYIQSHSEEFNSSGHFIGTSPHKAIFNSRFEKLMNTPGNAANEAIAALMCFYVGEASEEELMEAALKRGKDITPFLQKFSREIPITGLEPIPSFFTNIPNHRIEALKRIRSGEKTIIYEN